MNRKIESLEIPGSSFSFEVIILRSGHLIVPWRRQRAKATAGVGIRRRANSKSNERRGLVIKATTIAMDSYVLQSTPCH